MLYSLPLFPHKIRPKAIITLGVLCSLLVTVGVWAGNSVLLDLPTFLSQMFNQTAPAKTLWLSKDARTTAEAIAQRSLPLRVRYYQQGARTAWVLDEIGKEQPITMGIVVEDTRIVAVRIMEYREDRGGEVRYDFFTKQFVGAQLTAENYKLSQSIDGIAGATLSVRAVTKMARLALYLHSQALVAAPAA